mmetsp:Transcript_42676/g.54865  ORF Transcript_42676/g.54865 Transcript_42676/m.54865 type:complete len:99 (-) Transcript_42676:696-992(-)
MQRGFYEDVIDDLLNEQAQPSDDKMEEKLNSIVNPRLSSVGMKHIKFQKFKNEVEVSRACRSISTSLSNSLNILPTMGVDDIVRLFMKIDCTNLLPMN